MLAHTKIDIKTYLLLFYNILYELTFLLLIFYRFLNYSDLFFLVLECYPYIAFPNLIDWCIQFYFYQNIPRISKL